ncbi:MarC family protein [Roseivirga sp. E12]|uniref:MarC family protein n=1 Tax=Roseivirga sp. E12 TaxID=2819237 RepID=UPI001ABD21EF|nr:MarC family protein [Roseivirga sp. E12]MBO3697837.1 MarC family protein [Roseivirga sp. E12]
MLSFKEIISVTLILFSVIDILGSTPVIIDLRKKNGHIQSGKATLAAGVLMILFLFVGDNLLGLFGIDVGSFAIAGSLVMFIIGLEMILGRNFFKNDASAAGTSSIVPIAFPLIAGAGTLTTIISIRAEYSEWNILIGIVVNLGFVYLVLKSTNWLERKIGPAGLGVLQKVFGIILLSIAIKLFKDNIVNI